MDTRHRLFVADASRPWAFRRDLAVELGIAVGRLRVEQAHPPVQDAMHQGFTCRTAIGADDTGPDELDASVLVILDCRPISQGWKVCRAPWGYLNLRLLVASFGGSTPLFWRLAVVGYTPIQPYVAVNPGDVFTLVYVWDEADLESSATSAVGPTPLEPPDDASSCVACLPLGPSALYGLRHWRHWMAGCPLPRPLFSCGAPLHSTRCSPFYACGSRVIKWAGILIRAAFCPGIPWPTSVLLPRGTFDRACPFPCWPSMLVIAMRCLHFVAVCHVMLLTGLRFHLVPLLAPRYNSAPSCTSGLFVPPLELLPSESIDGHASGGPGPRPVIELRLLVPLVSWDPDPVLPRVWEPWQLSAIGTLPQRPLRLCGVQCPFAAHHLLELLCPRVEFF